MSIFYTIDACDELPLEYADSLKFFDRKSAQRFLDVIKRNDLVVAEHWVQEVE